jgi:hypothetical protein
MILLICLPSSLDYKHELPLLVLIFEEALYLSLKVHNIVHYKQMRIEVWGTKRGLGKKANEQNQ